MSTPGHQTIRLRLGVIALIVWASIVTLVLPLGNFYQGHQSQNLLVQGHGILTHLEAVQQDQQNEHVATQAALAELAILAKEIKADESSLAKGNTTLAKILLEAGAAVAELEAQEAAICAAVHCT